MLKRTLLSSLALVVLVAGVFAQDQQPTGGKKLTDMQVTAAPLPPKASALHKRAAHPGGGGGGMGWTTHRWEISFQGGAVAGGNLGKANVGACAPATVAVGTGCDVNQFLTHNTSIPSIGVYPGHFTGIRNFLAEGGVKPGTGEVFGIRLGVNVAPTWQVEFIWNHSQDDTAFSNQQILNDQVAAFVNAGFGGGDRILTFGNNFNGHPRGNQNMYLVNLNKQFNVGGRVQPYIGFGLGAETWYGNPKVDVIIQSRHRGGPIGPREMEVTKLTDSATGFAADFAGGIKFYATEHFGFRADFMDVMSFPGLTLTSQTLDSSNLRGFGVNAVMPISGTIKQSGRFNQALFTGGVFYQFGSALSAPGGGPSGDRDSMNDHWEFSLNFGGVHGVRMGDHGSSCTSTLATGCAVIQTGLGHDTNPGVGVYPGRLAQDLPGFQATGGITDGDGWMGGASLGFNLNPRWQVEFIWNVLGTGTKFDNYSQLVNVEEGFWGFDRPCNGVNCVKSFTFTPGQTGTPSGNQQQYLFNLNYNFTPNHRLVPYVGIGFGAEHWYNSPKVSFTTVDTSTGATACVTGAFTNNCRVATFTKATDAQTGFAFDVAAGVKYYVSRHWGLRADFMNVFSFQDFHSTFQSIDVSGLRGTVGALVPLSGTLAHTGHFSQAQGSGGFFFTF